MDAIYNLPANFGYDPSQFPSQINEVETQLPDSVIFCQPKTKKKRSKMGVRFSIKQQAHSKVYQWPILAGCRQAILCDLRAITKNRADLVTLKHPSDAFSGQIWSQLTMPRLPNLVFHWTLLDLWNEVRIEKTMLIGIDDVEIYLLRTLAFFKEFLGDNDHLNMDPGRFDLSQIQWIQRMDALCRLDCVSVQAEIWQNFLANSAQLEMEPLELVPIKTAQKFVQSDHYCSSLPLTFYLENIKSVQKGANYISKK